MSTALADRALAAAQPRRWRLWLWPLALAVSIVFMLAPRGTVPGWLLKPPRGWLLPLDDQISALMAWLVDDATFGLFTFKDLTRGLAELMEWPLWLATSLLASGFLQGQGSAAVPITPPLSWLGILFLMSLLAWQAGGPRLMALVGGAFLYLAVFGQWASAMVTLASIAIAVPFAMAGGLLLGIAAYRSPAFERLLRPTLDLMQTVPIFAYLVPILFLFGFGPVAAMLATVIYAMPPMARVALLALHNVPQEIKEYAVMAGCTRRQEMWRVLLPAARPSLMVGVNQVIMLSLNMVIIASMIGAGGLGYDVLTALRRLDIGGGLEAGIAITVLAIALDRLGQALSHRAEAQQGLGAGALGRALLIGLTGAVLLSALGLAVPALARYPASLELSTADFWAGLVAWININFFDQLEALKTALVLNLLVPVKRLLLAQPWPWLLALLGIAGWQLGGRGLALRIVALGLFIVLVGQWQNAMITVYLCAISVAIAAAIGIPIGIAGGLSPAVWRIVQPVIDTLQTLPSFVYLIPVVMLFRVGDFTAMIAIVLYAIAPAIRYTAHGVRQVAGDLVEAGVATGCTPRQLLWKIRLPLALPEIMLGVNQTIMLALSMLVITALVGTRDLGQEVYIALTKADVGRGIVAGLCVACIAIIADRLIAAGALRIRQRLGLT